MAVVHIGQRHAVDQCPGHRCGQTEHGCRSLRDHVDPRELPDLARRHHRSEEPARRGAFEETRRNAGIAAAITH